VVPEKWHIGNQRTSNTGAIDVDWNYLSDDTVCDEQYDVKENDWEAEDDKEEEEEEDVMEEEEEEEEEEDGEEDEDEEEENDIEKKVQEFFAKRKGNVSCEMQDMHDFVTAMDQYKMK